MENTTPSHRSRFVGGLDVVARWCAYVGAALLLIMAAIIGYDVTMRRFFNRPTDWAVDFSQYIMAYATFLGAAWVLRLGGHIRMDILDGKLGPVGNRVLSLFNVLASLIVCAILVWQGLAATWDAYTFHIVMMRPIPVPKYALLIVIPFGSLLMLLYLAVEAVQVLRGGRGGRTKGRGAG